jgi:thymidine phosphorylase
MEVGMSKLPVVIPTLSSEEKQKLSAALTETSKSLARAQGEQEYVREAIKKVSTDLKLPKKLISKLVRVHYKQNFDQEVAEHEDFEKLYQTVIKKVS